MIEVWKDIKGYDGRYQVSNLGNVFAKESYVTANGKSYPKVPHILKHSCNGNGYRYVTISINRKRKNHYVHRLVAEAFLPNPDNYREVNHLDNNRGNNNVNNLEWCTRSQNMAHLKVNGNCRRGLLNHMSTKIMNTTTGKIYNSIVEAAKEESTHYGTMRDALCKNDEWRNFKRISPHRFNKKRVESHPKQAFELGLSIKAID